MANSLQELIARGVLKPPLDLERTYKGLRFVACIEEDGAVTFDDKRYKSLSVAAATARAKALKRTSYQSTNGWVFWKFRDASGQLVAVDELRKREGQP